MSALSQNDLCVWKLKKETQEAGKEYGYQLYAVAGGGYHPWAVLWGGEGIGTIDVM